MKKKYFFIIGLVALFIIIFLIFRANEDNWIKDSRGVWIKHGNPIETPDAILEQQEMINCSLGKFNNFSEEINSQCLGACGDYAVDIINVPRTEEDNLIENQCADYNNGIISHFIELNKKGEIVRII
jgi:hypothetical protein